MASVGAFTEMMDRFLDELVKTFPEETGLKKYQSTFDIMKKANPRKCVEVFMGSACNFQSQIMAKDEKFFLEGSVEFLDALNIKKWWNEDLSESTKAAIWQYLQTLMILGTTITSIDADTLGAIEGIAEKMAKGSGGGEGGIPDLGALQGLMGALGNMKM
tara:strand:- start:3185 stop:3664 length:480 start_codon:yes stop_codon:yes gene_type:complete